MVNTNKIKKEGILILGIIIFMNLIVLVYADTNWPSYNFCCEKTKTGAWCQNALESDCDVSKDPETNYPFRATPTSCDSTSYCKLGCCINSAEGLCMENSPQRVCQISKGTWVEDNKCNVAQCTLGCCIIGDQASLVTLTRCKRLSAIYGLQTNFKKDITNEATCLMNAYSQDKGACVYEIESDKTCKFTTRQECTGTNSSLFSSNSSKTQFFKDYLCTADELGANCGPTTETMCLSGKDEVYFKDTCGNPANIYDSNRIYSKDPSYWKKVVPKALSCGYSASDANKNSKSCGNCNYITGSICGNGNPTYGNYICKDLNCYKTENGKSYRNGESWCVYEGETGNGNDLVGSRHFRHVCVQGEETIEPCADFRNEICTESQTSSTYGNFIEAACRVNRWSDCIDQYTEEDCLNGDKRDCLWMNGYLYDGSRTTSTNSSSFEKASTENATGQGILMGGSGLCLPNYPPGLKFWDSSDAKTICSLGNSKQIVNYTTNIFGTKTCKDNCEVLQSEWAQDMNRVCTTLGDCGAYSNIAGKYTDGGYVWKSNGTIMNGLMDNIKSNSNE